MGERQKMVWLEDGNYKTAWGCLQKVDGDLIFFEGDRGLIVINRAHLVSIK